MSVDANGGRPPARENDRPSGLAGRRESEDAPDRTPARAPLPPRWFIRLAWAAHRRLVEWTGGRLGLWRPKPGGWGTMVLTTAGRRTGRARPVIVGYLEDGPNLVTLAMNGWSAAEPAWWLNLQAHPDATARLVGGSRPVAAWAAQGDERERLWARFREVTKDLDAYAARRPGPTAVVILQPRQEDAPSLPGHGA